VYNCRSQLICAISFSQKSAPSNTNNNNTLLLVDCPRVSNFKEENIYEHLHYIRSAFRHVDFVSVLPHDFDWPDAFNALRACVHKCACVRACVCAWPNRLQNEARSKSNEPCPYLAHVSVESIRLDFPLIPIERKVTFRLSDRFNAQGNAINAHARAPKYVFPCAKLELFSSSFDRKFSLFLSFLSCFFS